MKRIEITINSKLEQAKDYINICLALSGIGNWIGNSYFFGSFDENDEDDMKMMKSYLRWFKEGLDDADIKAEDCIYSLCSTYNEFYLMNGGLFM